MVSKEEIDDSIIKTINTSCESTVGSAESITNAQQLYELNRQSALADESLRAIAEQKAAALDAIYDQLALDQSLNEDVGIQEKQGDIRQEEHASHISSQYSQWRETANGQYYMVWAASARSQLVAILSYTEQASTGLRKDLEDIALWDSEQDERVKEINDPQKLKLAPIMSSVEWRNRARRVIAVGFGLLVLFVFMFASVMFIAPPVAMQYFMWGTLIAGAGFVYVGYSNRAAYQEYVARRESKWYARDAHYPGEKERDAALKIRFRELLEKRINEKDTPGLFDWTDGIGPHHMRLETYVRRIVQTLNESLTTYPQADTLPKLYSISIKQYEDFNPLFPSMYDEVQKLKPISVENADILAQVPGSGQASDDPIR